jgi:hypothetical protein
MSDIASDFDCSVVMALQNLIENHSRAAGPNESAFVWIQERS